ncbi:hypothetical protein TcWFU_008486 [Taenia crassiceps]|uniref:Uncharacterized protein n=1 Tax=Taenia crassiceps TaxID=6207 RepID=A0ABR4PZ31_9CEST
MENSAELSTDNQTGPSETVELHSGENWTKERSFGDFLKSFETLKIESEDIARNVGETGDLSNVPAQRMYEEQLESAMSKMGLTMDDYLKARSVWSGDAAFDDKADATGPTSDQELSKLGLNEEEIRERRVAELTASLQVEKEEHKELEKVQTPPPPTSDDKAGETTEQLSQMANAVVKTNEFFYSF